MSVSIRTVWLGGALWVGTLAVAYFGGARTGGVWLPSDHPDQDQSEFEGGTQASRHPDRMLPRAEDVEAAIAGDFQRLRFRDPAVSSAEGVSASNAVDAVALLNAVAAKDKHNGQRVDGGKDSKREREVLYPLDVLRSALKDPSKLTGRDYRALRSLSYDEFPKAVKMFQETQWDYRTERVMHEVLRGWAELDPVSALAFAGDLEGVRMKDSATSVILGEWVRSDPSAAAAYAESVEGLGQRDRLLRKVAGEWARQDAGAAWDWFSGAGLVDDPASRRVVTDLFRSMSRSDPSEALSRAWSIENQLLRDQAVSSVLQNVIERGQHADVIGLYHGLSDQRDRDLVASRLVNGWSRYQPELASEWISTIKDPKMKRSAVSSLVGEWSRDYPEAAVEWVMSQDDQKLVDREVHHAVNVWAAYDLIGASEWATQMPPSKTSDRVVENLARRALDSDPEISVELVREIGDEHRRNRVLVDIAQRLVVQDFQRAWTLVNSSTLKPEKKNAELERLRTLATQSR